MESLHSKRVTVAGLGKFGGNLAAARWLIEQGAHIRVTDLAREESLAEQITQLQGLPIEFHLGGHRLEDFTEADLIVASPAISPSNSYLAAARQAGKPITTEICLFIERCPATIFGVTGTKGKSTAAALLHRILSGKFNCFFGGNIGKSLLADLPRIGKRDLVVLELSSFMLHYLREMRWSPHVALVTMLAADHMDWHGSIEQYRSAKKAIVEFQRPDDYAVLNARDPASAALAGATAGKVIYFDCPPVANSSMNSSMQPEPFDLMIPGRHNQLNAQGAFAAAGVVGVQRSEAQAALRDFPGLPHRLQLVCEKNGLRYYNDSIATIPEAAVAALESFPSKKVIQIVGGSEHGLPITAMCAALVERAKAVLCIGSTGAKIAECMSAPAYSAAAPAYVCNDLPTAMKLAGQIAVSGDVILLSPGYKSFDQFGNFEQRGEAFIHLARQNESTSAWNTTV